MLIIFYRTFRDRQLALSLYCLAALGMIWMYIALFPTIRDQSQYYMEIIKDYPEGLLKAFGIESMNFFDLEPFLVAEMYSLLWPIMTIFLMVSAAGGAIASEVEKGTMGFLLSQPLSRASIFWGKYLTGFISLTIFIVISVFGALPIAELYNTPGKVENFATLSLLCLLFGLTVFSFSLFISSLLSEKGKVYFIVSALIIIMYVINVVAAFKESLTDLKYVSLFYYFDSGNAFIRNEIATETFWVFIASIVTFTFAAFWTFRQRDIAV